MARAMHSTVRMNAVVARTTRSRRVLRRMPGHYRRPAHRAHRLTTGDAFARGAVNRRATTLLELVQAIQVQVSSDAEVVTIVRWLINSGAVVLTGSFAGQRI